MEVLKVKTPGNPTTKRTVDRTKLLQLLRSNGNAEPNPPAKPITHPTESENHSTESMFSDFDLYLFSQGTHDRIYNHLGAQVRKAPDRQGVNFSVWAPNAREVSVVGDFNQWDNQKNPLSHVGPSGIWECNVPNAKPGDHYKFRLLDSQGRDQLKIDPFGFACERAPKDANIVVDLKDYSWADQSWMDRRASLDPLEQPVSIYEIHLGSWQQNPEFENGWICYRELAKRVVEYCNKMGFTHVELLPISEHPYTGSWGYQTVGYYAATSRYGSPADFMYFVDLLHQNNIGVILDWVPGHFPRDAHGLREYDGTALYEHSDPKQADHPDWGTLIFNYGRTEVRNFLISNALFWLDHYHIDGLRVDAVASMLYLDYSREGGDWVPNKFGGRENLDAIELLKQFNERAHADFPGIMTIAEESTTWSGVSRPTYDGGLGFSLKWNMGWMNDTLQYFSHEPVHRKFHHDEITFSMMYAYKENFVLPLSHDEVVHGKRSLMGKLPGDQWQKFANLRLLYTYMWTHPGKKLLFMGNEFAQWIEWNVNQQLDWHLLDYPTHEGVQRLVGDLNEMLTSQPSLYELDFAQAGFQWITCDQKEMSVLGYTRKAKDPDDFLIIVCNFTPVVRDDYRIQFPAEGTYREIFNSDSLHYGGTNVGNLGTIETIPLENDQHEAVITLPPLGGVVFRRED